MRGFLQAPEYMFSYSFPPTGITYLAYALASVVTDLSGLLEAGLLEQLDFAELSSGLLAEQGVMLDSFSAASGDFEGILQGGMPVDLSPFYEQSADAGLEFFLAATPDFVFTPGTTPEPAPRTIRVPRDVADLQQAVFEAGTGDTIVVKGGSFTGPLVIQNKQGLTLRAKGARLLERGLIVDGCSGLQVRGLRIDGVQGNGISVTDSTDVVIERCRLSEVNGHGVEVLGSQGVCVDRLKLRDVTGDGVVLGRADGAEAPAAAIPGASADLVSGSQVMRCRLGNIGGDGLTVAGSGGHLAERNAVKLAGGHGVEVSSPESTLLFNRATAAAGFGFFLHEDASGNTLSKNRAAKNASGPLSDTAGGNTYEGNSFDGP